MLERRCALDLAVSALTAVSVRDRQDRRDTRNRQSSQPKSFEQKPTALDDPAMLPHYRNAFRIVVYEIRMPCRGA